MHVVAFLQNNDVLPAKILGATVCVAIIDRSSHAKARALACRICLSCLEQEGLAGLGKKGVVVAAKSLSEETIPENRAASLDLLEAILVKMNGDMQRLVRICGPNLTNKGRQLLEERWSKRETREAVGHPRLTPFPAHVPRDSPGAAVISDEPVDLHDQLPAFSLRVDSVESKSESHQSGGDKGVPQWTHSHNAPSPKSLTDSQNDPGGAAANLRARLLKLRERNKVPQTIEHRDGGEDSVLTTSTRGDEQSEYGQGISRLKDLIARRPPVDDEDEYLVTSIDTLKKFHAALSKQQHAAAGLTVSELSRLREVIASNLNETLSTLTR